MKKNIRVMLVEDNLSYREIILLTLSSTEDIELAEQFGSSEAALRHLKSTPAHKAPDLILLDLRLPGMDGLEALPHFRAAMPSASIIVLTQSDAEADVLRAITLGASGYLLKSATLDQLTEGIRTVMDGGAVLDTRIARFILKTLKAKLPQTEIDDYLTPRELEVLHLLSEGRLKKEIGSQLDISFATVDSHFRNIYEKLGVHNAPSAVRKASVLGLFQEEGE
ncbi:MAG: response regulator transcription factor [Akkermansiaceae bacterium]|tara:strand:- start:3219 stop:3887 length:669 start_codon:yes stop_codon:yes gene_type:complete